MEFLMSLSKKAKEKLSTAIDREPNLKNPNKSVMYTEYVLSDEDVCHCFCPHLPRLITD